MWLIKLLIKELDVSTNNQLLLPYPRNLPRQSPHRSWMTARQALPYALALADDRHPFDHDLLLILFFTQYENTVIMLFSIYENKWARDISTVELLERLYMSDSHIH